MDRLRRSVLFTPGTRPERFAKALREGRADVVVADLEDAVPPGEKAAARAAVGEALRGTPAGRAERGVRINAWPGGLAEDDLDAVLAAGPDLLVVPKVEEPDAVRLLDDRLAEAEEDLGREPGSLRLLLVLESAAGVLEARALAGSAERVAALAFGAEDLAADAGLLRSPGNGEVAYARAHVALAAAAARVQAIDMVTVDFQDTERTGREMREARALGYAGKMCIHPAQVEAVHAALRPTDAEAAWARRVVAAAESAGATRGGVVVVDGRMVDVPLVAQARRVLAALEWP